jgi:hypothetical protein
MHNALDSITSSFITSTSSAVNNGGSKADATQTDALDEQFSGLLNQAFHGQKPGTQQAENAPASKAQSATHSKTKSQTKDATPEEQDTQAVTDTEKSEKAQDTEAAQSTDKKEQIPSAEEVQALLQSLQPLALTILKTTHLLGQNHIAIAQAGEISTPETQTVNQITPATEQISTVGTVGSGKLLGSTGTAPLLPLAGSQPMLAFALPGQAQGNDSLFIPDGQSQVNSLEANTITAEADAQTQQSQTGIPVISTENSLSFGKAIELPEATTSIVPLGQSATDVAASSDAPSQQPAFAALALEASGGNAQSLGLGLNREPNRGIDNIKPNASLPSAEKFQKTLNSLHQTLGELNGEIEPVNQHAFGQSTDATETAENLNETAGNADTASLSASDLFSALGGNSAIAPTGAERANDSNAPVFTSLVPDPVGQVAEGTAYSVKNGQKELIIRLNPDNLGEVRVNLTSHGNKELSARLIASTVESHDLLKSQLEGLKTTLEAQGVTVERLSVVLAGHTENSNGAQSQHQSSTGREQSQDQQQHNTQQGSTFQQQYNPQNPASSLFGQMGGQSQPGWAQRVSQANTASGADSDTSAQKTNAPHTAAPNDNGRISILA